jgi:hypothetical protein
MMDDRDGARQRVDEALKFGLDYLDKFDAALLSNNLNRRTPYGRLLADRIGAVRTTFLNERRGPLAPTKATMQQLLFSVRSLRQTFQDIPQGELTLEDDKFTGFLHQMVASMELRLKGCWHFLDD